jgi:hypothetical protein
VAAIATALMAKQYLRGELATLLTSYFPADADAVIEQHLLAAQNRLELVSGLAFGTVRIKCKAQPDDNPVAGTYDALEPPYSWDMVNESFPRWLVRRSPLVSCQEVRVQFSEDVRILGIPSEWIRVEPYASTVTLVPVQGALIGGGSYTGMGVAAAMFLQLFGRNGMAGVWPQLVYIDYTVGLGLERPDVDEDGPWTGEYADLVTAIAKYAAGEMALQLGQVVNAGAQSTSLGFDGVSQSVSYAGKGAGRFADFAESLKAQALDTARFYRVQKNGVKVYL